MTRQELIDTLSQWIGEILRTEPPRLEPHTDLEKDLNLDSLALAELAAKLRFKLKIKLRASELGHGGLGHELRVGQLVDLVMGKLEARGPTPEAK